MSHGAVARPEETPDFFPAESPDFIPAAPSLKLGGEEVPEGGFGMGHYLKQSIPGWGDISRAAGMPGTSEEWKQRSDEAAAHPWKSTFEASSPVPAIKTIAGVPVSMAKEGWRGVKGMFTGDPNAGLHMAASMNPFAAPIIDPMTQQGLGTKEANATGAVGAGTLAAGEFGPRVVPPVVRGLARGTNFVLEKAPGTIGATIGGGLGGEFGHPGYGAAAGYALGRELLPRLKIPGERFGLPREAPPAPKFNAPAPENPTFTAPKQTAWPPERPSAIQPPNFRSRADVLEDKAIQEANREDLEKHGHQAYSQEKREWFARNQPGKTKGELTARTQEVAPVPVRQGPAMSGAIPPQATSQSGPLGTSRMYHRDLMNLKLPELPEGTQLPSTREILNAPIRKVGDFPAVEAQVPTSREHMIDLLERSLKKRQIQ